jgi:UDP-glucose 4-epimerase
MKTVTRWIITGANGYLGGEVCKKLAIQGEQVVALVRPGKQIDLLAGAAISCHTYDDLPFIFSKGDVFVHCAGIVGNTGTWKEFKNINIDWSISLFKQAAEYGVSCFVYVSSVAALGYRNRRGIASLDESSGPKLIEGELYGRSKWSAEKALERLAEKKSTRLVILRPGLVYGRRPFGSFQTWLKRGIIIDPDQRVPLVHSDSFLNAVMAVATKPEIEGSFFVVDDEQPALRDLIRLRKHYGLLRYDPWRIGRIGFWLMSLFRTVARILRNRQEIVSKGYTLAQYHFLTRHLLYRTDRLKHATGWRPAFSLIDGLRTCISCEEETTRR